MASKETPSFVFFRIKELWVPALFLLAAILFFVIAHNHSISSPSTARLYHDNDLLSEIDLKKDREIQMEVEGKQVVLEIQEGRIRFRSSGCPDHLCVQAGFLSEKGQYAVCLPLRLLLIIPDSSSPVDIIAGGRP